MPELFLTFKPVVHGYDNLQAVIDCEVVGQVVGSRDHKGMWRAMICGVRPGLFDSREAGRAAIERWCSGLEIVEWERND